MEMPSHIGVEGAQPVSDEDLTEALSDPRDLVSSTGISVPAGGRGFIWIYSEPAGAALVWDGKEMGITPIKLALPVGEQMITATMTGRTDRRIEANISQEQDERVTIDFDLAELRLDSIPARAAVYRNGEMLGVTPESIELEPGVIEVELRKDGYDDKKERFVLRAGQVKEQTITMSPTDG
jgi:hypothetical protein